MPRTLYTIGYEGRDIDRFVAALKDAGVEVLADVRAVPLSRKKGFSKNGLRSRLQADGIGYRHFVELGTPETGRKAARAGNRAEFSRITEAHLDGVEAQAALAELAELAGRRPTCLMCFERDPQECHRLLIAGRLQAGGMKVEHLI
jgi:uncharacterized protein (DUF488 family)